MEELGELEKRQQEFANRKTRVIAISNDNLQDAQATKSRFPHLDIVSDSQQNIAKSIAVLGPKKAPDGSDTNSPTTILLDGTGTVRWLFRPDRFIVRLSPGELLFAVDANLPKGQLTDNASAGVLIRSASEGTACHVGTSGQSAKAVQSAQLALSALMPPTHRKPFRRYDV
jgi:hypothetical protein